MRDISSNSVLYLTCYPVSFYTDKECKDNGATPPFDQCVTSTTKEKWRSFAIRECAETKRGPVVE